MANKAPPQPLRPQSFARKIAGVIACGAGFPEDIGPSATNHFPFFGAAGVADFNYPELKKIEAKLVRLGATIQRVDEGFGEGEARPMTGDGEEA